MKKVIFTAAFFVAAFTTTAVAQEDNRQKEKGKKESQEIIIKRKGNVDVKVTVEIKDDKITINGKPLAEFKDDNVTINRRNITVWDGSGNKRFEFSPDQFMNGMTWSSDNAEPKAFLGVSTVVNTPGGPESDSKGAEITSITEKSPAEKAELKPGDIITKINSKKVTDPGSLSEVVGSFKPKEEVTVYYTRDGKEKSSKVTLGERRQTMAYSFSAPGSGVHSFTTPRSPLPPNSQGWNNMEELQELGSLNRVFGNDNEFGYAFSRTQRLGIKIQDTEEGNGVKILDVEKDSPADKAGLKKDDVLTEVAGKKVTNTDEAREQLQESVGKPTYSLKAKRGSSELSFDIKIPKKLKTANL